MQPPKGSGADFFLWLKAETERQWAEAATFSMPRFTTWRRGLSTAEIHEFETAMGYAFPAELRVMLSIMNGTSSPVGEDVRREPRVINGVSHVYGYPDDLDAMRSIVGCTCANYEVAVDELPQRGIPRLHPIIGHRFLIVDGPAHPVLSSHSRDTIVYGASLRSYLLRELLAYDDPEETDEGMNQLVPFWLDHHG